MKIKHFSKPQDAVINTQKKISRTKLVRKRTVGRPQKIEGVGLPPSIDPDLKLALEFGEAILSSAILLSDRLNQVSGDTSTRIIQEALKLAQANFDALRTRVQGGAL